MIDYGLLNIINFEFFVTENVKMQVQADQFIKNLIWAFALRLMCLFWHKQNLGLELFLSALKLLMVHTLDNIQLEYWVLECSYTLIVSVIDKIPILEEYGAGSYNLMYQVPLLTIYLFGMCFIMVLFGKNFQIDSLKMQIKIKEEIIERLVKNNDQQSLLVLKLNEVNLQKVDFSDLSTSKQNKGDQNSMPFVSFENSQKINISPQKILYDVVCYNKLAKKSLQNKLLGPAMKIDLKKRFNILDIQHKFRSIQVPKKQKENLQEKNLHKILNQGSALLFKDIMQEKLNLNNTHHFKSFDQITKIEKIARIKNSSEEDSSQDNIFSSQEIDLISDSESEFDQELYAKIKYPRFKKLSNYSMVLFDDIFKIDKNLVQQIQCIIVYDTFLLQFFEPIAVENMIQSKQHDQEYQMELLNEERPTQSLYVIDKNDPSDLTKHRSKHLMKQQAIQPPTPIRESGILRGKIKQDKTLLKLKNAEILEFEEGSLRSKDMLQGSQSSTIKININQSESSPRSFYSEVNKTRKLNQREHPYHKCQNQNIHQRIQASELKNEQKEMALEFYKKKVADLERDLVNTKVFLNMVIHDLRNPINNINFGIDSGLSTIKKAESLLNEYEQDLLNDFTLFCQQKPRQEKEINNFDEELISEFQNPVIKQKEEEKVENMNDASMNIINNIPIIDPKSNNAPFKKRSLSKNPKSESLREEHKNQRSSSVKPEKDSKMKSVVIPCEQKKLVMRQASLSNSAGQSKPNEPSEPIKSEADNNNGEEIMDKIGKMSVDIDDQKSLFLQRIHNLENSEKGIQRFSNHSESQFKLMDQSIHSNQKMVGHMEEEKVAKKKKNVRKDESSHSLNSQESEKQANKNASQIKSKFFALKQLGQEEELEDEDSESRQMLIFQKNSNQIMNKISGEPSNPIEEEEDDSNNDRPLDNKLNYKKMPSKIQSSNDIYSESHLKFSQNPSSLNDDWNNASDIPQEHNNDIVVGIEKIQCPKFGLKSNYSCKKLQESPAQILDREISPMRECRSNISDSVDQLFENDQGQPVSQLLDNLMVQNKKNMPKFQSPKNLSCQELKERMKKRKRELNLIRKCLSKAKELLEGCEYSSNLTANLINDLLDFAKTEKFCFKISKEWFNLGETINNAFNVLKFESKRKGIQMKLSVSNNDLNSFNQIYSDESRYMQILLNLLSNSLKFTPNNGLIEVKLISQENILMSESFAFELDIDDNQLAKNSSQNINRFINRMSSISHLNKSLHSNQKNLFRQIDPLDEYRQKFLNRYNYLKFKMQIIDNGVGISEENLKNLFIDFNSLHEHQKLNPRGTGLGLSICKNLIEKMGGNVKVSSVKDKGSTFTVEMIEVQRLGQDKRELFDNDEENKFEEMMIKNNQKDKVNLVPLRMDLIQERNSRSEDGIDSNPSNNLVSREKQKLGCDLLHARNEIKQEENRTVKNSKLHRKSIGLVDSCQFINNLGIVDSMNSNEIDVFQQPQRGPKMVLFEQQNSKKHYTNNTNRDKQQSNQQSHNVEAGQKFKKKIEEHMNQYANNAKLPAQRESNIGSLDDISLSESQVSISQSNHDIGMGDKKKRKLERGTSNLTNKQFSEFQHLSILIANDEFFQILAIEQILNKYDIYDIGKAENGLIAYEKAMAHKYDFIILDINMPIMDGIEAGKKILEHYSKRGIMLNDHDRHSYISGQSNRMPLIFGLSSYVNNQLIKDAKAIGFTNCIQAPFSSQKAAEMLNYFLDELIAEGSHAPEVVSEIPPKNLKPSRIANQKYIQSNEDIEIRSDNSSDNEEEQLQKSEEYNASFSQSSYISRQSEQVINRQEKSKILAGRVIPKTQSNLRESKLSKKQQLYLKSQSGVIKEEDSEGDE